MISIRVNGSNYVGFISAEVSRCVESISGKFSFYVAPQDPDLIPIKVGDKCEIAILDDQINAQEIFLTGFIETLEGQKSTDNKILTYGGRDFTADIIDSSFVSKKDFSPGQTLEQIITASLREINLSGINIIKSDPSIKTLFSEGEVVSAEQGDNIFEFLTKYAKKKQVLLTTDGKGSIVLARASTANPTTELLSISNPSFNSNNLLDASITIDETKRFNKYQTNSQQGFLEGLGLEESVDAKSQAFDNEVRNSRVLSINVDSSTDELTLGGQAKWERNYRRAQAFEYKAKVQGHFIQDTTNIWKPNILVSVIDTDFDINATLLIKEVAFSYSVDAGSTTKLTMVRPDAFTLEIEKRQKSKKSSQGDSLTNTLNLLQ